MSAPGMAAALAELDGIMREIGAVSQRSDEQRKFDLVQLRRRLALQLPVIATAAETCTALSDPEIARQYRDRFSEMRTAIALHQATWPAVSIDNGGEPYRQSAANVRRSNEEFLGWTKAVLAAENKRGQQQE